MQKELIIIDPVFMPGLLPLKSIDFQSPSFIKIYSLEDKDFHLAKVVTPSGMLGIYEMPENIEKILDFLAPEDDEGQIIANKMFDRKNRDIAVAAPFPLAYYDTFDDFALIQKNDGWEILEDDNEGYFLTTEN